MKFSKIVFGDCHYCGKPKAWVDDGEGHLFHLKCSAIWQYTVQMKKHGQEVKEIPPAVMRKIDKVVKTARLAFRKRTGEEPPEEE